MINSILSQNIYYNPSGLACQFLYWFIPGFRLRKLHPFPPAPKKHAGELRTAAGRLSTIRLPLWALVGHNNAEFPQKFTATETIHPGLFQDLFRSGRQFFPSTRVNIFTRL
jgi:hypothetical protein